MEFLGPLTPLTIPVSHNAMVKPFLIFIFKKHLIISKFLKIGTNWFIFHKPGDLSLGSSHVPQRSLCQLLSDSILVHQHESSGGEYQSMGHY
jgi:hypothetical protein